MSRREESPQVHKLPHGGNLPHLKWQQTLSPPGKLLISSLFANAEMKVSKWSALLCEKDFRLFPHTHWWSELWVYTAWSCGLPSFSYITVGESHEVHFNRHPGDSNLAEGHCSNPFPCKATTGLGHGDCIAGSSWHSWQGAGPAPTYPTLNHVNPSHGSGLMLLYHSHPSMPVTVQSFAMPETRRGSLAIS